MNIRNRIKKAFKKERVDPIRVARSNLETQQYKLFEALEEYIWQVKVHGSDELNQQLEELMEKYHLFPKESDWSLDHPSPSE